MSRGPLRLLWPLGLSLLLVTACGGDAPEPADDVSSELDGEATPDVSSEADGEETLDVTDGPGTITSVCCETSEGAEYTTNVDCDAAGGSEVALTACPALCCDHTDGSYSWIPPGECQGNGIPSHPGHCEEVCCQLTDETTTIELQGNCAGQGGVELELAACAPPEEPICCRYLDGTFGIASPEDCAAGPGQETNADSCLEICCQLGDDSLETLLTGTCMMQNGQVVDDALCEPPAEDVCCAQGDGSYATVPSTECAEDAVVDAALCEPPDEKVCCAQEDGSYASVPSSECEADDVVDMALCEPPVEDVCCAQGDGSYVTVPSTECAEDAVVDAALCEPPDEKVCCGQEDGSYASVPSSECEADDVVDMALCEPPVEDVCCAQGDGSYVTVPSTECEEDAVVDAALCEPDEPQTCCKTEEGVAWVPEGTCDEESVLPEGLCERPFCCKVMTGPDAGNASMMSSPDCLAQGGSVVYDGYCEQLICCETDAGSQLMPFMDCTFAALQETSACEPVQEEACCKVMSGPDAGNALMALPSVCAELGGAFVGEDFCTQEICCETDTGPQMVPYMGCTFLQLTETSACEPVDEMGCCKDMENPGLGDAYMATTEDCFAQGGSPIFQEYCDQEVCCDMGDGPEFMPYAECTFLDMVATYDASDDPCSPAEELECCKISFGVNTGNVVMATPTDCAEQGGINTVQEYCDQEVCCETADGMAYTPFLECPFMNVNAESACTPPEEEGCCQIILGPNTGNVILATPTDCAIAYGLPNTEEFCTQTLCCQTEAGPVSLPFLECPFADVIEAEQCVVEEEACCKISSGPDTGNVVMATPTACEVLEGIITDQEYCDQLMCCNTEDGPQQVPFLECAFTDLSWEEGACDVCCQTSSWPVVTPQSDCEPALVLEDAECDVQICCSNGEGAFFEGTPTECAVESGEVVDDTVCNPPDEPLCCAIGEEFSYILASECTAQSGTQAAPSECVVCCQYPGGGLGQDPATFCIAGLGTIVDDALCEAPEVNVCCGVGEDTTYISETACSEQEGAVLAESACYVCCKNPFGEGPAYALEQDCDQVQPDAICDPMICCATGEDTAYVTTSACTAGDGAETAASACMVCCEYSGGGVGEDPAAMCVSGGGTIVDDAQCEPAEDLMICCQNGESTDYILTSECTEQGGAAVADAQCPVCCEDKAGLFSETTAAACASSQGNVVDDALCEPVEDLMICCDTGDGTAYIATSECTSLGGEMAGPTECQVCCEFSGGGLEEVPAEFCLAGMGSFVDDALCAPEEEPICCAIGEDASYITPSSCTESGGVETALEACQVCCKNPNGAGPEYVFEAECETTAVQPDSVCATACDAEPCQNGGVCTDDGSSTTYTCDCEGTGYTGDDCETLDLPEPCDASTLPQNADDLGDCTEVLQSGSECSPTCSPGYTLSAPTSCDDGVLTQGSCLPEADDGK